MRIVVVDGSKGNMQGLYLLLMSDTSIDGVIVEGNQMDVSNVHLVIKNVDVDVEVIDQLHQPVDAIVLTNKMASINIMANAGLIKSMYLYSSDNIIPDLNVPFMEILMKEDITNEMISHARMMGMSQPLIRGVLLKEEWYDWNFYDVAAIMYYMKSRTDQSSL